ncbi:MAG: DUF3445 domain-containing protein [Ilumatobacter sp.]|uniref:heme-dependent oxidative N-demethylase family protein n=1 Tax=Ilumatobacter sp. TaxID=1967498 RepID=UPI0032971A9D
MPVVESLPYTPWRERGSVVGGDFRWRLGIRPLDLDDWIEFGVDSDGPDGWLADKARILADHHETAVATLDGIEAEATEVADAVVAHLAAHEPHRPRHLGPSVHPLDAAGRLVPEDLVLMVERDGRLVFGGGSVCFPNRWDLRSKLGRTMAEVHAPVAGLNDQLEVNIDQFLARLRPDRPFWRLGWGVIDVADGYTPTDGTAPPRPTVHDPSEMFVRVERETLRRFPDTGCVLFTIRTYVTSLGSVTADGESAHNLAAALDAMSPAVLSYKDLSDQADALVELLAR